ncbi:MAG: L,D-transpeptidase family protein [Phenylobacterium sp.]|uniref:L,D-transpeptidase family protein n=1 Tax=Phenylobacterium sp. TaxID=1871053 RepID=UPI0025E7F3CE|nr:L,D-transpeptidase family protein [Phenylobacterium sp.]MCA6297729.1 L,D-transpeptidase family protein [Phenylobacterium sp.]
MKLHAVLAALALAAGLTAAAGAAPPPDLALSGADRAALEAAFGQAGRAPPPPWASDAQVWEATERLAQAELGLRVQPADIDPLWAQAPATWSPMQEMASAYASGRLAAWSATLAPDGEAYAALARARLRYAAIVDAGGWPDLPEDLRLRLGDVGPGVLALRQRLAAEGAGPAAPDRPEVFDPPLKQSLVAWQARNGLEADGVVGPATRARLAEPAATRLARIEANLERWRWLPRPLPRDRLEIDTGGAVGALFRDGRRVRSFRVIVGAVRNPTPLFLSEINGVVLNPPWNVPDRIAREEILPRAALDPGYLERNGFVQLDGRLQQAPGPLSALGLVKFDLVSPFGVFLHDTPGREAFRLRERHLSHGCMRVEQPLALADLLLAPQGRGGERLMADLATGRTQRIALSRPIALVVVHWTVRIDPDGQVGFLDDVYGWDARLARALPGM